VARALLAARIIENSDLADVRCPTPVRPDNVFTARSDGRDLKGFALTICGANDNLAPCDNPMGGPTRDGDGLFDIAPGPTPIRTIVGADDFAPSPEDISRPTTLAGHGDRPNDGVHLTLLRAWPKWAPRLRSIGGSSGFRVSDSKASGRLNASSDGG
jgi:hypothetical protein